MSVRFDYAVRVMRVTFHGVRGSIATPGLSTVRYGGNTSCVELRLSDGTLVVLDAGTGIRELGRTLLAEGWAGTIHLLISHTHWDHIIGFPFFGPIWQKTTHVRMYPLATTPQEALRERPVLFDEIHFPVRASDIPARLELVQDAGETWRIGSANIRRIALNHPGGAQGFRVDDEDGSSLAYLTDNELTPPGTPATSIDELARFARGAGLVVHDAQYLPQDMPAKRGWGHSIVDDVLELGRRAETPALVLYHHEPERDDDALDAIGEHATSWMRQKAPYTTVVVAREGTALRVPSGG